MRRYTNTDVMNDERLPALAYHYLGEYAGDFDPLVAAQKIHKNGNKLTPTQVRMVLNCMLADMTVINMPEPERKPYDASKFLNPGDGRTFATGETKRSGTLTVTEPERWRPAVIPLKSKWKLDFGTSTHKQARVIHLLDHERHRHPYAHAPVIYYPYREEFQLNAYWQCGANIALHLVQGLTLPEANALVLSGERTWCRRCDLMTEGKWTTDAEGNRTKADS